MKTRDRDQMCQAEARQGLPVLPPKAPAISQGQGREERPARSPRCETLPQPEPPSGESPAQTPQRGVGSQLSPKCRMHQRAFPTDPASGLPRATIDGPRILGGSRATKARLEAHAIPTEDGG